MIGGDDIQILKRIVAELGYKYVCHNPQAFASAILDICDVSDVKQLTNTLRSPYSAKLMAFFLDGRSESATWAQQKTFLIDESGMSTENAETVLNVLWQVMGWQRQQPSRQALIHSEEAMPKVDPKFKKEYVSMDRRDTTPGTDPPKVDAKFRKEYAGMSGSYHKAEDAPPKTNTEAQSHSCNAGGQPPHIDQPQNASLHNIDRCVFCDALLIDENTESKKVHDTGNASNYSKNHRQTVGEDLTCPWCKGKGHKNVIRNYGKGSSKKYWVSNETCGFCNGTGLLLEEEAPSLLNEFNDIKNTREYKNANPKCSCCGGTGFVNFEESNYEPQPCPFCAGNKVPVYSEQQIQREHNKQLKRKIHLRSLSLFFGLFGCLAFPLFTAGFDIPVPAYVFVEFFYFALAVVPLFLAIRSARRNRFTNRKALIRTIIISAIVSVVCAVLFTYASLKNYRDAETTKENSMDPNVLYIQEMLCEIGILDSEYVTGVYDDMTTEAVRRFQQWANDDRGDDLFSVTGEVDSLTMDAIEYVYDHLKKTQTHINSNASQESTSDLTPYELLPIAMPMFPLSSPSGFPREVDWSFGNGPGDASEDFDGIIPIQSVIDNGDGTITVRFQSASTQGDLLGVKSIALVKNGSMLSLSYAQNDSHLVEYGFIDRGEREVTLNAIPGFYSRIEIERQSIIDNEGQHSRWWWTNPFYVYEIEKEQPFSIVSAKLVEWSSYDDFWDNTFTYKDFSYSRLEVARIVRSRKEDEEQAKDDDGRIVVDGLVFDYPVIGFDIEITGYTPTGERDELRNHWSAVLTAPDGEYACVFMQMTKEENHLFDIAGLWEQLALEYDDYILPIGTYTIDMFYMGSKVYTLSCQIE